MDFAFFLSETIRLIISRDPDLMEIVGLTFRVSGIALLFSSLLGIPLGALLGLRRFIGRRLLISLLYTGMGFTPVVIGLLVYLFLSRTGPLGAIQAGFIPRLFTPTAMIVAQTIISFPLMAGFTMAAVMGVDPQLKEQMVALRSTPYARDAYGARAPVTLAPGGISHARSQHSSIRSVAVCGQRPLSYPNYYPKYPKRSGFPLAGSAAPTAVE